MNAASPTKRRAALATLDANATTTCSTPTPGKHHADTDPTALKPLSASRRTSGLLSSAPVLAPPPVTARAGGAPSVGMKRGSGMVLQDRDDATSRDQTHAEEQQQQQQQQQAKKSKREHHGAEVAPVSTQSSTRSRTHSPDASSVFDASGAEDATWVTTATEPEFVGGGAALMMPATTTTTTPPRVLTREQAREKVEILRLRLGLASYKLRTGQVEVPLADLQPRPLLAAARPGHAPPDLSQSSVSQEDDDDEEEEEEEVVEATPPPPAQPTAVAALAAMASRRGFGYVDFSDSESATRAYEAMQGQEIDGRALNLDYANAKPTEAKPQDRAADRARNNYLPALV